MVKCSLSLLAAGEVGECKMMYKVSRLLPNGCYFYPEGERKVIGEVVLLFDHVKVIFVNITTTRIRT